MHVIRAVPAATGPSPLRDHARTLFHAYGEFLRDTQACGTFDFHRYAEETDRLPDKYVDRNGEVLLALNDHAPAACLAFWASPADASGATCEIKRLFVAPPYRNLGLARTLLTEAMRQAKQRGFSRVVLDTDLVHMPAAVRLYTSLHFKEYGSRAGNIAFFERLL